MTILADIVLPTRHGCNLEHARRETAGLRSLLRGDPDPTPEQWRDIGAALLEGDRPMDVLLDWMMAEGFRKTKPLFDLAATQGINAVADASSALRAFFDHIESAPDWVDEARLEEGARCSALAGRMGNYVLRDAALVGGYRLSAVNKTLVATGALEKGPASRLLETTRWWIDATRPGGLRKFAPGYVSTLQVRLIHALVRRKVAGLETWDAAIDGVPVNQADMHITYLGFSIVYIIGQQTLGVPLAPAERQAIMDLWRYIGWLMGVDPRWLHATDRDALIALYQNGLAQAGPDESSRILAGALTDEPLAGMHGVFGRLRGRWDRAVHLSVVRTFVGVDGMAALGLPKASPWYPLLTGPWRYLGHSVLRALPGGRTFLIRRGLAQQAREMSRRSGLARPEVFAPAILSGAHA
jgi:hypothetical protein